MFGRAALLTQRLSEWDGLVDLDSRIGKTRAPLDHLGRRSEVVGAHNRVAGQFVRASLADAAVLSDRFACRERIASVEHRIPEPFEPSLPGCRDALAIRVVGRKATLRLMLLRPIDEGSADRLARLRASRAS